MWERIQRIADHLLARTTVKPTTGIILGTGLSGLADEIEVEVSLPYEQITGFPVSTVEGHPGKLHFGTLGGTPVVAMQGRFHYYEGYDMREVTLPVRVMKLLGIERLFLSNASGGVDPEMEVGDLMVLNDHIDLFPDNPLRGANLNELGPRFPDMSEPYDKALIARAHKVAAGLGVELREGVYAGVSGPCFETPAEYRRMRIIGADAVGMSTVPEVIVARHMGLPCFAMSVITDLGVPGRIVEVTHEEVQAVARKAEATLTRIFTELVQVG